MKRWLFNILSAFSMLVFLATIALWATGVSRHVYIDAGGAGFSGTQQWGIGMDFIVEIGNERTLSVERSSSDVVTSIGVPYWLLTASAMVLPAVWLRRRMRQNRFRQTGLCRKCGYDLRESKDRCPECGTPIPAGASPGGEDKAVSRPS